MEIDTVKLIDLIPNGIWWYHITPEKEELNKMLNLK